jgi:hypothetical protein
VDAAVTARRIQQREGWSDAVLLDLLLGFLHENVSNDAVSDYLEARS